MSKELSIKEVSDAMLELMHKFELDYVEVGSGDVILKVKPNAQQGDY